MYWRFDETVQHVELDYPRDMSMWGGIPKDIDSVFQSFDKKTYFFKGQRYLEFDDRKMNVVPKKQPTLEDQSINVKWLKCPPRQITIRDPFQSNEVSVQSKSTLRCATHHHSMIFLISFALLFYTSFVSRIV